MSAHSLFFPLGWSLLFLAEEKGVTNSQPQDIEH